jgi:hypothetical protein
VRPIYLERLGYACMAIMLVLILVLMLVGVLHIPGITKKTTETIALITLVLFLVGLVILVVAEIATRGLSVTATELIVNIAPFAFSFAIVEWLFQQLGRPFDLPAILLGSILGALFRMYILRRARVRPTTYL